MRTSAALGCCLTALIITGCQPREAGEQTDTTAMQAPPAMAAPTTDEEKIQNAMAAAPDSIARAATIMDWPDTARAEPRQLRAGTNAWVCFPAGDAVGEEPMCLDAQFQRWADALMNKRPPRVTAIGIGYMLRGDKGASLTDPYGTEQTSTDWIRSGPHIMVVTPNVATLAALPGTPTGGGPYVMWKGTPYAHIMVPLE